MPHRVDDDFVGPNHKDGTMGRAARSAVMEFSNLNWKGLVFAGKWTAPRIFL